MSRPDLPGGAGWIDRALFTPVDPTAVALFRIALACMVVRVFWPGRPPLLDVAEVGQGVGSFHDDLFLTWAYWAVVVALATLLALGVRPRFVGATLAVLLLALVPFEGRQGRQLLTVTLLAFSFLRSDAAFAITPGRRPAPDSAGPIWPIRIVQLQLSALYAANAIAKTTPDYLSGQTAAVMMEVLPNFLVRPVDGQLAVGALSIPLWVAATCVVLTEYALAVGFWFPRTRVATAVLGVVFHAALRYVVRIGFLDVVALFLYSAFLLPFGPRWGRTGTRRAAGALEARPAPAGR
jgi:hypothetical protein